MKKINIMTKIECMVFVLLVFCLGQVCAAPCGDVNSSGGIDIVDALLIAQYYVGLNPSNFDQSAADSNGDSSINIVDALLIARYYVGLIPSLPGYEETPAPTPDHVETPGPTNPPATSTVTIQAENVYCYNAEVETEHSGYTGSGYVNTENEAGPYLEWEVNASNPGNAGCVFTYANGGDSRPMELTVNGNTAVSSLDFPGTGGWTDWNTVGATVSLASGRNTMRLTSLDSEGAPNLDKIDISFSGTITIPDPTPVPTADPNAPFVETYVPDQNADDWEDYIEDLDYRIETGGNGGSRTITNPILVRQGTTYDGRGERLTASGMGDGSQDEGQRPYFLLEPGATLKNVTICAPGCEGVHCMGDNTLENVHWEDIGEDAMSVRSYFPGGDITVTNGSAYDGDDKCFQFNKSCTVRVTNFECARLGKFIRQNGGTTFALTIYLDTVTVNDFEEAIVRSDSPNCHVYYRNIRSNQPESEWWMLETTPQQF